MVLASVPLMYPRVSGRVWAVRQKKKGQIDLTCRESSSNKTTQQVVSFFCRWTVILCVWFWFMSLIWNHEYLFDIWCSDKASWTHVERRRQTFRARWTEACGAAHRGRCWLDRSERWGVCGWQAGDTATSPRRSGCRRSLRRQPVYDKHTKHFLTFDLQLYYIIILCFYESFSCFLTRHIITVYDCVCVCFYVWTDDEHHGSLQAI